MRKRRIWKNEYSRTHDSGLECTAVVIPLRVQGFTSEKRPEELLSGILIVEFCIERFRKNFLDDAV